jgi:DNA-binding NarL/FixJ family response regulator
VNDFSGPHDSVVNLIVAATSEPVRRDLVGLANGARFNLRSVAGDPQALAELLRRGTDARVVTGGSLALARPFLRTARMARAAVVAVLSGGADADDRTELGYSGLAVLRSLPRIERFAAAVVASSEGLSVWDPEIDSPADATEPAAAPLSPRERTVLELTGAGYSTKAVARRLGISPNTVKFHLQEAFQKLNVTSRAEAVVAAIRRGELTV